MSKVFPTAQRTIRIASAYFSIPGYRLARSFIRDAVQIHVLVGREDGAPAQGAVIEEIFRDLARSEFDLWEAINDLVKRIRAKSFFIRDARRIRTRFHCKFYICDDSALWHGSANYTAQGLDGNAEQATLARDREEIERFTGWYDDVARDADDILGPLADRLEAWLQLCNPFDVYLSTLHHMLAFTPFEPGPFAHNPVYYQRAVVRTVLQQLGEYKGAVAVVATGLGKTVIGAEVAFRLREAGAIDGVLVVAPSAVHRAWEEELDARGVFAHKFTKHPLFSAPSDDAEHRVSRLEAQLARIGPRTLIVLDEAHFARNQLLRQEVGPTPSRVLQRLNPPVARGAPILLLTATPYSTTPKNLDSLLALLPEGPANALGGRERWTARSIAQFLGLPVVTKLGFPDVLRIARQQGDVDNEDRPFVAYGKKRQYLPREIHLRREPFAPVLEAAVTSAFDAGCFQQASPVTHTFHDEDGELQRGVADSIAAATRHAWLSSPEALRGSLQKNLRSLSAEQLDVGATLGSAADTQFGFDLGDVPAFQRPVSLGAEQSAGFRALMSHAFEHRAQYLQPLLASLRSLVGIDDTKLARLSAILNDQCRVQGRKAVVFVRSWRTGLYLEKHLKETFGLHLPIGCTVADLDGRIRIRPLRERMRLQRRFSPVSHGQAATEGPISVLISTDADSMGVNLQDAEVVVNYDLPEAADALFQRAGRVLRMTADPHRQVFFHTFVPTFTASTPLTSKIRQKAELALARLHRRHGAVASILLSPVMGSVDEERASLDADVPIDQFLAGDEMFGASAPSLAATAAEHYAVLEANAKRAAELGDCLHSAREYDGADRLVFALVRHSLRCHHIVFALETGRLLERRDLDALNLIACEHDCPRAFVPLSLVEAEANRAVRAWCSSREFEIGDVEKICAVLLLPRGHEGLEGMLRHGL